MDINIEEKNGVFVLYLSGRMDATTVSVFDEAFKEQLATNATKIIVNMQGLVYISSAGLRGILISEKSARAKSAHLCFCCMQDMVTEVFKISGFSSILKVYTTEEEALEYVTSV